MKLNIEKWKHRAMAFAVRAHNHLWGKNNEDPLVFLFDHGLSHDFSRQIYLGWNKFGQERPYENWGIQKEGKFFIPPGIVFPYIVDKALISLFILSMETPDDVFSFPGNPDRTIILGNRETGEMAAENLLEGLSLFQANPENGCIKLSL